MASLTFEDYKNILEYYNKPLPRTRSALKQAAEKLLASKLCRCIKLVPGKYEARAIGACTKTVLGTKGLTHKKFTCRKKQTIQVFKRKTARNRPRSR
jgi:hypothetical protein